VAWTKMPKGVTKVFSGGHTVLCKLSGAKLGSTLSDRQIDRRSGTDRTVPLIFMEHGDGWASTASLSRHDIDPAWYLKVTDRVITGVALEPVSCS